VFGAMRYASYGKKPKKEKSKLLDVRKSTSSLASEPMGMEKKGPHTTK